MDVDGGAPSLPLLLLLVVTGLLSLPVYLALKKVQGNVARFVIAAIFLRYIMSAFHQLTFKQAVPGLSWNAIGSILVVLIGLYLMRPRDLLFKSLLPVYAIIVVTVLSAAANHDAIAAINSVVKHLYFIVIMIATYRALKENGGARFFTPLLWSFAPLPFFQLLSVILGKAKASELDGSVSYIGGYNHEAAFSIALATFFVVMCFAVNLPKLLKPIMLAVLVVAIGLANYRTTLLALFPFAGIVLMSGAITIFVPRQRAFVGLLLITITVVFAAQLTGSSPERFRDLMIFFDDPSRFIKPPAEFSFDDRRLLSGRAYIWSGYLFMWMDGSLLIHLLGFGPDSWPDYFKVYPHNTIVAYLFELGLVGVFLLLSFWLAMLRLAFKTPGWLGLTLVFAHLAFIFMNLATMAMWQIEGVIFYAILCGFSLFSAVEAGALQKQARLGVMPSLIPKTTWGNFGGRGEGRRFQP
jgi:hypothetical protein